MHDHKIIIGVIYKPPESNTDIFVAHFSDLMGIISKERKQCILMGDFNLDLIKVDTHNQTKDFVHSLYFILMHFTQLSANLHASLTIQLHY